MPRYLDTETIGLAAGFDEILQIGLVDEAGNVLLDTLVRPTRRTEWPEAEKIHGITPADVADAPTQAEEKAIDDAKRQEAVRASEKELKLRIKEVCQETILGTLKFPASAYFPTIVKQYDKGPDGR